jgi:molybdenum-dependent DNA-binding transcriptional regulator ModE
MLYIWKNRDISFQKMEASMNRLEAMSVVLAVAEAGSLSAAARRQKTPLATVSRKVSELEAHLQTKLFNRSTRALDVGLRASEQDRVAVRAGACDSSGT